jgi:signal peptidase II
MIIALAFSVVLTLDQAAKALVVTLLRPGTELSPQFLGVRICHLRNARPRAGILLAPNLLFFIWLVMGCALPILLGLSGSLDRVVTQIGLGVVLGGSLSNLIDRAARGGVIDFINPRVWPVFNLADSAILLGTLLMCWSLI